DILNLLRALSDPWDDLAMVGFLRSPATGMSDLGITQLRWSQSGNQPVVLRQALTLDHSYLTQEDKQAAGRALDLLGEFEDIVGKIPVAALLQRLIERSHYRIILAGSAERGWRNIEKLLMDAYTSHQTSIHAYLEYVQKIRDIGVREGEAAGAAEDALQLMTIHKSKGLEFPWVILADAGRRPMLGTDRWQFDNEWLSFLPDRVDYKPLLSRYLKKLNEDREDAETRRLLYVAFTRARDKLIISGHFSQFKEKFSANGWLKEILNLIDLDPESLVLNPPAEPLQLFGGERIGIQVRTQLFDFPTRVVEPEKEQVFSVSDMLVSMNPIVTEIEISQPEESKLDLFEPAEKYPMWVGKLLHRAIQRWDYRDEEALEQFLERSALEMGILDLEHRMRAVKQAKGFFQRLKSHPVYDEINQASRHYHEVPFESQDEPQNERGRLDVLYLTESGWKIVDFKTDHLATLEDLNEDRRSDYRAQLLRYQNSVFQQLKEMPVAQFCFLNCGNAIQLVNLEDF
ncbi:MAG: PD-(D/E)XK nuclease family protein, partial [Anaerolineaceae bacterium]|nr:PD-(D/E)XK nuclease family protein [Anaerolineaceae bacterium]